ncbi:hypothetical protein KY285_017602 [Solanum tuberosum]|nr:hypothetical protein KY285_017602 [Solanum tuberosum]
MEIPQTFNEFKVWSDDFIIPKDNNLKSIINNNNPSTTPLFLIEIRVQEFMLPVGIPLPEAHQRELKMNVFVLRHF